MNWYNELLDHAMAQHWYASDYRGRVVATFVIQTVIDTLQACRKDYCEPTITLTTSGAMQNALRYQLFSNHIFFISKNETDMNALFNNIHFS